jgi:hypothetical protein
MDEIVAPNLNGYRNDGPVRVGNAAAPLARHISWLLEFLGAEFFLLNPYFFVAALIALVALWLMPRLPSFAGSSGRRCSSPPASARA